MRVTEFMTFSAEQMDEMLRTKCSLESDRIQMLEPLFGRCSAACNAHPACTVLEAALIPSSAGLFPCHFSL